MKTIEKYSTAEFIEKKSRFISHTKPVQSESEAVDFINEIKSKYSDATHNVYAYNVPGSIRFSDDGEPSKTAGMPTLNVINKKGLSNIVIVTTRYFGGILLGAGGLVRAYSKAASMVVDSVNIIDLVPANEIVFIFDYSFNGKIQNIVSGLGYNLIYQDKILLTVSCFEDMTEKLIDNIVQATSNNIEYKITKKIFIKKERS